VRSQPWMGLQKRGVWRIWYQTEPTHTYLFSRVKVDEIWDFSYHNINAARRPNSPKAR